MHPSRRGEGALAFLLFGQIGAVMAVVGHMWSLIFRFRGGRGGATTIGVFLAADPVVAALLVLFTVIKMPFIKNRRDRERFDQYARVALLLILPFTGYVYWKMLWAIAASITVKYWQVGI